MVMLKEQYPQVLGASPRISAQCDSGFILRWCSEVAETIPEGSDGVARGACSLQGMVSTLSNLETCDTRIHSERFVWIVDSPEYQAAIGSGGAVDQKCPVK